jgi:DNA (cytosine-5)-methyltransferase 1
MKMKVLDLFSGIGGFSLGLERTGGFETVAFCEQDAYCQKVLAKHWPDVPIFDDVKTLRGENVGSIDVVCGGFPCQPWSVAGQQKGTDDNRDLWPEMCRIIADVKPRWVIGENVAGFVSNPLGLDRSLADLETLGYSVQPFVIPACAVDAPHRRDRVWVMAHRSELQRYGCGEHSEQSKRQVSQFRDSGCAEFMADAKGFYAQGQQDKQREKQFGGSCRWIAEPDVGRVAHGIPRRVDRLKALGNAVVPQIPEMIGHAILESAA